MELTEIFKLAIELIVAIASMWLIPWLRARLSAEQMSDMLRWAEIAVSAAEQLYDGNQGRAKKQYVLGFLSEHGYDVDEEQLNIAIESAVLKLHKELTE